MIVFMLVTLFILFIIDSEIFLFNPYIIRILSRFMNNCQFAIFTKNNMKNSYLLQLNTSFARTEFRDIFEYIASVDCKYYFGFILPQDLGLRSIQIIPADDSLISHFMGCQNRQFAKNLLFLCRVYSTSASITSSSFFLLFCGLAC